MNPTISNLTVGGGRFGINSIDHSLTVTGATTIDPIPDPNGASDIYLGASASGAPITFALGSLSTFANGVLTGSYSLGGPATLQFNGADVITLSGAEVTLGSASRIVDENGIDGLRNLARIEADSSLVLSRQFATAGDFTMDGRLSVGTFFFVTGSLTNFDRASRTLRNGYYVVSATLQFSGADIVNNGATLYLAGLAKIVDETGRDALRNFSHNLATGQLRLSHRDVTISGDFTNDGLLDVEQCSITINGALTNYDAASKTLNGGKYRVGYIQGKPARISFTGADIVHNNASLVVRATITDEKGNDALRNLIDNQAGGELELHVPFTSASDFTNAGTVRLGRTSFTVPAGHVYRQSAGNTALDAINFSGDIDLSGGELTSVAGNVNGDVQLSSGSTWHYVANIPNFVKAGLNVSGTLALGGTLEVEYPGRFAPASLTNFYIATAGQFTGAFSNAANGTRIMTTDGAGSFVLSFESPDRMLLGSYERAVPAAQLLNISTRAHVVTGNDVAIGGFIIYGRDPKKVIVRAMGPSLAGAGVSGALQDPTIEFHDATGAIIATNDNWQQSQSAEISETGLAPGDSRESAIVATLQPGAYTAVLRGANNATGVALVEVYDLSEDAKSKLANISTRGFVDADHVLIGGLIAGGNGQANAELVVRAIGGFSLEAHGVKNSLADPALTLRDGNGALVAANDDFLTPPENSGTVPTELRAPYQRDAATGVNVPPGQYTVVVYGKNSASGNALVEIYDLNR